MNRHRAGRVLHEDAAAGFSLLEVMVSVALFGMLGVLLFGGLRLGGRIMDSATLRTGAVAQVAAVNDFLRNQLGQALPVLAARESGALLFQGDRNGVEFITLSPLYIGPDSYQRLSIRTQQGQSGKRLIARWRPFDRRNMGPSTDSVSEHETVLLDDVTSAEFAYFDDARGASRWQPSWQSRGALPALVRVRLGYDRGRQVHDLIVALRLQAS